MEFNSNKLHNMTETEFKMLVSRKSDSFLPEVDIPAINRRLTETLQMREKHWTSHPPGNKTKFPSTVDPKNPIKVLLVGVGGVGKSRLGSILCGGNEDRFTSSQGINPETEQTTKGKVKFQEQKVEVFDTPGYVLNEIIESTDTHAAKTFTHDAIKQGLDVIQDGVHVIVFVINAGNGRAYEVETKIMEKAMLLNPETFRHCMMVVTHCKGTYIEEGRDRFLVNIKTDKDEAKKTDKDKAKKTDKDKAKQEQNKRIKKLLEKINSRVVLVDLGNNFGDHSKGKSLDGYTYKCEKNQAREMVMAMIAKVVDDNARADKPTLYPRESMEADLEVAMRHPFFQRILYTFGLQKQPPSCFPTITMAYTSGGNKTMDELHLNDIVLVVDEGGLPRYEPVILFSHAMADEYTTFVCIKTQTGKVLRMSPGHLIPIGELGTLKAACHVNVGDVVFAVNNRTCSTVAEKVVSVGHEQLRGLYCPHTPSGTIVVDGVVASCYTDIVPTMVAHGLLLPVRLLHRVLPMEWFTWLYGQHHAKGIISFLRSTASFWQ